ncbi:unnamed protein product [Zymoseptoria tritici ST99CH_3D1]|nr:unnamed protein product [Zymoseptoria tritici ST99CH_3D1]
MDIAFPYTRYACLCSDTTSATPTSLANKRISQQTDAELDEREAFDPHDLRSNYSLYPLDQLLFCEDCNHIRCSKCWSEEMLYWYCPSCLFDVPSSMVKGDGNRCTRHCYDCPICAANLAVTAVSRPSDSHLRPTDVSSTDSYILQCQYCEWSSIDIGVRFNKPTKITEQLNKIWKQRHGLVEDGASAEEKKQQRGKERLQHDLAFANLSKFYKEQLSESGESNNPYSSSPYGSPANLARIMSLYGGLSYNALKKSREKPQPMREAGGRPEGLSSYVEDSLSAEDEAISKMKELGLESTSTPQQKLASPSNYDARFVDQLWPVATPLRVRRGRRCRTCRQFVARPEGKVGSTRYKIKLLAATYVQRLSIRPLQSAEILPNPSFRLRPEAPEEIKLQPYQTQHYILTIRNPLFESVKVTLSTPSTTPGKVSSKVTILCPSFIVGPDRENMWDEALSGSTPDIGVATDGSRRAAMASLTGSGDTDRQPEAGKIWERSRNLTSVILEVVPGSLTQGRSSIVPLSAEEQSAEEERLREDDDLLEIPIFVRAEWEAEVGHGSDHAPAGEKKQRESKELAYWCVLGVGRIAS